MTESLADGPDWHLRSRFRSGLSLLSEDKELQRKLVDLQKRFLIYRMYPKYLEAHLCVAAIRMKASIIFQNEDV